MTKKISEVGNNEFQQDIRPVTSKVNSGRKKKPPSTPKPDTSKVNSGQKKKPPSTPKLGNVDGQKGKRQLSFEKKKTGRH
jgi:hypothetical protein